MYFMEMGAISQGLQNPQQRNDFASGCFPPPFPPSLIVAILTPGTVSSSVLYDPLLTSAYLPTFLLLARERTIYCLFLKSSLTSMTILWVWFLKTKQQIHAQVSRIFFKFLRSLKESSLQSKRKGGVYPALYKARCVYRELKLIQQPVLSYIKLSNYKAVSEISLNKLKEKYKEFLLLMWTQWYV